MKKSDRGWQQRAKGSASRQPWAGQHKRSEAERSHVRCANNFTRQDNFHRSIDESFDDVLVSRNGCRPPGSAATIGSAGEPSQRARRKYIICFRFVVTRSAFLLFWRVLRGRL